MERSNKHRKKVSSWLMLHVKDVKRLIYKKLNVYDIMMIKMAHRNLYTCSIIYYPGFANHCAMHGYYTLYQWALKHWENFGFNHITEYFIAHAHAHNITWDVDHDYDGWHPNICNMAADFGHVAVLQWAASNGYVCDKETCIRATMHGHINILEWMRVHKYKLYDNIFYHAAAKGHLNVLQWVFKHYTGGLSLFICLIAKQCGHDHIIQWMHENKHPCPCIKNKRVLNGNC